MKPNEEMNEAQWCDASMYSGMTITMYINYAHVVQQYFLLCFILVGVQNMWLTVSILPGICPQLRTKWKTYGKQTLLSKLSTMAYLTMVVVLSWQLLTQYYTN